MYAKSGTQVGGGKMAEEAATGNSCPPGCTVWESQERLNTIFWQVNQVT